MFSVNLRQLVDALGGIDLVAAPQGDGVVISRTVIYEPREPLRFVDHGILLAVGLRPGDRNAEQVLATAADAGMSAVLVKTYDESTASLAGYAEAAGVALLAVQDARTWQQLDVVASAALSAAGRVDSGTTDTLRADLFGLADAIATSVGGATTIEDPQMRILAYSSVGAFPIDDERQQVILGLQVPGGPPNNFQYRKLARTRTACRFPAEAGGLPRVAMPIRAGDELLGSLWVVDAGGRFDKEAERRLSTAADLAALHLLRNRTMNHLAQQRSAELLRRLFDEPSSAPLVATQLGLAPDSPVVVAALAVSTDDSEGLLAVRTTQLLAELLSLHFGALYGRHVRAVIGGTLYALLPAGPKGETRRELLEDITRRAQSTVGLRVYAALGSIVDDLRLAGLSRREADLVLRVLAAQDSPKREVAVATIDEVRAPAMLAQLADVYASTPGMPTGLAVAIWAYDDAHGTEYARTLAAYLDSGSDTAITARHLNIHANTCRYRISRAAQLFGFDLADPDQRLALWLELRFGRRD